jgi:hypothetical protein
MTKDARKPAVGQVQQPQNPVDLKQIKAGLARQEEQKKENRRLAKRRYVLKQVNAFPSLNIVNNPVEVRRVPAHYKHSSENGRLISTEMEEGQDSDERPHVMLFSLGTPVSPSFYELDELHDFASQKYPHIPRHHWRHIIDAGKTWPSWEYLNSVSRGLAPTWADLSIPIITTITPAAEE